MLTKNMTVEIQTGLEARPVAVLVQVASQFDSAIFLEHGAKKVNAKSIMGMMALALKTGEEVKVHADGHDAEEAIDSIEKFLSTTK